jgi:hypothetical protein
MKDKEIEIMLESYLGMEDENILFLATGEVADIFNNKKYPGMLVACSSC